MTDYPVGYKRPPVHTRFKPGRSGNPMGRPKGRKSFPRVFEDILNEKVTVRHGDEVRKASPKEVMSRTVIQKAMKGDLKAFSQVGKAGQRVDGQDFFDIGGLIDRGEETGALQVGRDDLAHIAAGRMLLRCNRDEIGDSNWCRLNIARRDVELEHGRRLLRR